MPQVAVGAQTWHYIEQGKGLPVVLLHGFPLDCRIWEDQVAALSRKFRIIAPDLPGFGQSPSGRPFSIASIADEVKGFIEALGVAPCILAGLSMGGYTVLNYALRYPQTLRGIMLVDSRAEADTEQGKAGRNKMIEAVRAGGSKAAADQMLPKLLAPGAVEARPQLAERVRRIMEACPAKTVEHALAALRERENSLPRLGEIKLPTLIIVGDQDQITPPAESEKMRDGIAGSKLAVIKGAGHLAPMEQPEQVNTAMRKFLGAFK